MLSRTPFSSSSLQKLLIVCTTLAVISCHSPSDLNDMPQLNMTPPLHIRDGSVLAAQSGFLNWFSASSDQKAGGSAVQLTRLNASAPAISHQGERSYCP